MKIGENHEGGQRQFISFYKRRGACFLCRSNDDVTLGDAGTNSVITDIALTKGGFRFFSPLIDQRCCFPSRPYTEKLRGKVHFSHRYSHRIHGGHHPRGDLRSSHKFIQASSCALHEQSSYNFKLRCNGGNTNHLNYQFPIHLNNHHNNFDQVISHSNSRERNVVEIDTPNIHTPPEGHGPPEPTHTHTNNDMEIALEEAQHSKGEEPTTEELES